MKTTLFLTAAILPFLAIHELAAYREFREARREASSREFAFAIAPLVEAGVSLPKDARNRLLQSPEGRALLKRWMADPANFERMVREDLKPL